MFKSELELFVVKRIAVYLFLCSMIILFFENRWYILPGAVIGSALSVIRFAGYAWIFKCAVSKSQTGRAETGSASKSVIIFMISQIIFLSVLVLAYLLNIWFFAGLVAGTLSAPLVIMINSITEAFGITKNGFFIK